MTTYKVFTEQTFDRATGQPITALKKIFFNICDCAPCRRAAEKRLFCLVCMSEFRKGNPSQHFRGRRHKHALLHSGSCEFCPLTCRFRHGAARLPKQPDPARLHADPTMIVPLDGGSYAMCCVCGGVVLTAAAGPGGVAAATPDDGDDDGAEEAADEHEQAAAAGDETMD
jgi:hypothetical protein